MTSAGTATVTRVDRVLRVELANPGRRNALTDDSMAALIEALEQARTDESVGALLITGADGDFCSGFDVVGRNSNRDQRPRVGSIQRRLPGQAHRLVPLLCSVQVPVVSAVSGYAVGLGMQIALASDFVVADPTARFWQPFLTRGMTPDSGATWLTTRAVGPLRARRLLMLGTRLDAATALEWGIVHEVTAEGELAEGALALATDLSRGPTVALGLTKALINTAAERTLAAQLADEAMALELSSRSPDFKEGLAAFVERRDPAFTGR